MWGLEETGAEYGDDDDIDDNDKRVNVIYICHLQSMSIKMIKKYIL